MKTFLEHVAQDIIDKYQGNHLAHIVVVFPNKRAALFLNQALSRLSDKPLWSPAYITISDLFRQHSPLQVADPIKSVAELHKSFVVITGKEETLDQFFAWGQLLLSDFDDIDKNAADAAHVFRNLRDLHELDDISYLNEEQKSILKRFFSHFHEDGSILQKRFIELWSRLFDIYTDFRARLRNQGLAYEGMLYRDVSENPSVDFRYEKYLFVGFNVLQKVEQSLFARLKHDGKAAFYWDYDRYYLQDNEAGVYIRKYLDRFPNELDGSNEEIYDNLAKGKKEITFISAPTENIQARYVTEWLRDNHRIEAGNKTAIVMCNEGLLQTIIHCIPEEAEKVNVTTGFPLQQTPIASLILQLITLQSEGFTRRQNAFRLHYLNLILRHPYAQYISPLSPALLSELNANKMFYVKRDFLMRDDGLSLLFKELDDQHSSFNAHLLSWLKALVKLVAIKGSKDRDPLFQESLFRIYTLLNRLSELIEREDLSIDQTTLQRFIRQLISATSVPFHGEPAVGIQIMGLLETRNLDFDHVLVLSCNEGSMPKGVDDASFIPHALRKAYELTTIDNKVAIYSYYFHSLLQRAHDVTVVYNNSTEGTATGEMSRFMLQLLVELDQPIHRLSLQAGQTPLHFHPVVVSKDETILTRMQEMSSLSPTAINSYMRCPLQFFYKYVADIKEPDDNDDDDIDNRIFGNIFHRAAQLMYEKFLPHEMITEKDITRLLHTKDALSSVVSQAFSEELFHLPVGTIKHPPLNGMQLINREVIETYLRILLHTDKRIAPFKLVGHELKAYRDVQISTSKGMKNISIGGRIDRLDMLSSNSFRLVDYKTGNRTAKDVKTLEAVFDSSKIHDSHTDYILQTLIYSSIIANENPTYSVAPALLFIQHAGSEDYDPILTLGNTQIKDMRRQCGTTFDELLVKKIEEIYEPENPFSPTQDRSMCNTCPYRQMCGR